MKNIASTILLSFVMVLSTFAQSYSLLDSEVGWKGKAAFNAYALSGSVELKGAGFQGSKEELHTAKIVMDMTTIQSDNARLIQHLKSKDFFEVKRYKRATFVMKSKLNLQEGKQEISGELSIKDSTHPISFPVELKQEGGHWMIEGIMSIDRTQYGITFNSPTYFEKLKEQAIADEFELSFSLTLGQPEQAMR
ncbi:MAG: YceI family protein [Saprospiraceae bacterium]|nr:YceI family protein [Saprospiraceae bacterium]